MQPPVNDDVRRELDFHLDQREEELVADGWSRGEARAEAERRFGDRSTVEEACRSAERKRRSTTRRHDMFDVLRRDISFSIRQLGARPAFTLAALLTLTLGVGAVSTMYTLVQGVLLYQLPFEEADRVVNLWELNARGNEIRVSRPNIEDWTSQAQSFESLAFYSGWWGDEPVQTANGAVNAQLVSVSGRFFEVLGVQPLVGRVFSEQESSIGGPLAAMVSETFWRSRLGAPASLAGVDLQHNGEAVAVVGVVPDEVVFPAKVEVWTAAERYQDDSGRTAHNWSTIGRLKDGVDLASARAEMNSIATRIKAEHGDDASSSAVAVRTIKNQMVGNSRRPLLFLFGASALVLLLAATNLASGMLARAIERANEMALRSALGAGAGRLVRQLLTESVVLTTLGGLLGTGFAYAALALLRRIDSEIPRLDVVTVDLNVLLTTLILSALTGLGFGLVPALHAARTDLRGVLDRGRSGNPQRRAWTVMVGTEAALALVLLVGSVMLLSELWELLRRDTGFRTESVVAADIAIPDLPSPVSSAPEAYVPIEAQAARFHARLTEQMRALPNMASVALTRELPLRGTNTNGGLCLVPRDCRADKELQAYAGYRLVSSDYFQLLDIPVLEGRSFLDSDSATTEFVAVVNRAFAERYYPQGAVGQQVLSGGMDFHGAVPTRIVGVVGNVLHLGLDAEPVTEIFYPAAQRALRTSYSTYLLRPTDGNSAQLLQTVRTFLAAEYPQIPPEVATLDAIRVESVGDRRFTLMVLSALALTALGLALTGIWAVVTFRVTQQRREIGVRVALGLSRAGVLRMVLSDTTKLLIGGVLVGSVIAFIASRLLHTKIAALESNLLAFLAAAAILMIAGILAGLLPARRAAAIPPTIAMRE